MRRGLAGFLILLSACGGASSVMVEPDPLPDGAVQLFSRSTFDIDRGLVLTTNGEEIVALYTEQDQDGHRLVFARYTSFGAELSEDVLELSGASGSAPVDLQVTPDGYVGLFVRFSEDARTFLLRYDSNGVRDEGIVALDEAPLYAPGPVRGQPRGLPRLARSGERFVLVWPGAVGSQVVLHAGFIDLETGKVTGERLMDTIPDAYPAPSRIQAAPGRLWFAWLEQPASGLHRLRTTALDAETLRPMVSGAIIGREVVGLPAVSAGRIAWSGVPFSGGETGLYLTRTSSGAAGESVRIGESADRYTLSSYGSQASIFTVRDEKRMAYVRLNDDGLDIGNGESWARKSPVLELEATQTASVATLFWEEQRSDGVRVGVLRFLEGLR